VNTFNAALEAEYAGNVAAGTIATFDPVLFCQIITIRGTMDDTHKMILVGRPFATRKGRKACVNATRLKKLTFICWLNFTKSK
jgi:hypothetical protein